MYDCKSLKQYSYLRQVAHPPPRYASPAPLRADPVRAACAEPGQMQRKYRDQMRDVSHSYL